MGDYRRSVDLLEKLLADSPGDSKIRRFLAEALGLGNLGCCLRSAFQTEEAERLYRRAIQIRRELLRGTSSEMPSTSEQGLTSPASSTTYPTW